MNRLKDSTHNVNFHKIPEMQMNHEPSGNAADNLCRIRMGYVPQILPLPLDIKPDISITPVPQETIKTELEHSPVKNTRKRKTRSPRQPVRLISQAEAVRVPDPYSKRKSLPLEKCHICKKFFRRMETHLSKHQHFDRLPSNPLGCSYCTRRFNTQSNLLIHLRTHTGDKPYICDVCHKGFAQSCNLTNHLRIHTGEKPFKCPYCVRAFTQSGNLNNHIRLHTDEKPFKCHFCDRAFVQSGNLNSHIKNNHSGLDETDQRHKDKLKASLQ